MRNVCPASFFVGIASPAIIGLDRHRHRFYFDNGLDPRVDQFLDGLHVSEAVIAASHASSKIAFDRYTIGPGVCYGLQRLHSIVEILHHNRLRRIAQGVHEYIAIGIPFQLSGQVLDPRSHYGLIRTRRQLVCSQARGSKE